MSAPHWCDKNQANVGVGGNAVHLYDPQSIIGTMDVPTKPTQGG